MTKSYGELLYDTQILQIIRIKQLKESLEELEQEYEDNKKG